VQSGVHDSAPLPLHHRHNPSTHPPLPSHPPIPPRALLSPPLPLLPKEGVVCGVGGLGRVGAWWSGADEGRGKASTTIDHIFVESVCSSLAESFPSKEACGEAHGGVWRRWGGGARGRGRMGERATCSWKAFVVHWQNLSLPRKWTGSDSRQTHPFFAPRTPLHPAPPPPPPPHTPTYPAEGPLSAVSIPWRREASR
jgi:hypothetical protein